jgi:hypothetical protein
VTNEKKRGLLQIRNLKFEARNIPLKFVSNLIACWQYLEFKNLFVCLKLNIYILSECSSLLAVADVATFEELKTKSVHWYKKLSHAWYEQF